MLRQFGPKLGVPAVEAFIESYPNSVWTPSLRNNLGFYYRNTGRYSLAFEHWEAAWNTTKMADSGKAKAVADFALAHLTRLLASLGRKETLAAIFQESRGRVLDGGPLEQIFHATKEAYAVMVNEPGVAYRCGTLALGQVARLLQPENPNRQILGLTLSPESGFSLSALKDLADRLSLNLVAVQRVSAKDIVVPSVVHWQLNHYAAITERSGDRYKVEDPTFGRAVWMDADTLNAESSGYFLVPSVQLPGTGWRLLSRSETDFVFGRGFFESLDDENCESCPTDEDEDEETDASNPVNEMDAGDPSGGCKNCNESGGPPDDGPNDASCPGCGSNDDHAMPVWRVVEPNITLWLLDKPIFYSKSYGKRQLFKLMYKQRNTRVNSYGFGFGSFWECNRLSYFRQDSSGNITHFVPGGGTRSYQDENEKRVSPHY